MIYPLPTLNPITGPTSEPVTLAWVQNYIKNDVSADEDLINLTLIPAARAVCEQMTGRAFFTQTHELVFDYQLNHIKIPLGQLASITSIKTYTESGAATTEDSGDYYVKTGDHGSVTLVSSANWTTTTRQYNFFRIQFVAGWATEGAIPFNIKNAIAQTVSFMYYNRDLGAVIPDSARLLLQPHVLYAM